MAEIARKTKRYPSDLTDEEWARMAPLMPALGLRWRMLPTHFGHWRTVYGWFREPARRFLFQTIHDVELMPDRERAIRDFPNRLSKPDHPSFTMVKHVKTNELTNITTCDPLLIQMKMK